MHLITDSCSATDSASSVHTWLSTRSALNTKNHCTTVTVGRIMNHSGTLRKKLPPKLGRPFRGVIRQRQGWRLNRQVPSPIWEIRVAVPALR